MTVYAGTQVAYSGATGGSLSGVNTVCLTDPRNGQAYRVRKMPDSSSDSTSGKCWMLDNLRYAQGYCEDPINTTVTVGGKNYCNTKGAGTTSPYQDGYWPDSTTKCGFLYTWQTAITGNGNSSTYGTGTDGHTYTTSMICPTGWTLPANGVYGVLNTAIKTWISNNPDGLKYGGASAFQLPYAGCYYSSSFYLQGSYGYYWSSTEGGSSGAYDLYFNSSGDLLTSNYSYKVAYYAVRCYR
jgi:uncharacterized protein (TIGR02145 family)